MPEPKPRLTADVWLSAGFRALAESGPDALKAEPLARALGTTKGSFYWHFSDVTAYRTRLVARWEHGTMAALAHAAETDATPTERLHGLAAMTGTHRPEAEVDAAIRAWARHDHTVSKVVSKIDAARLAYIRSVLSALGLTNPDFPRLLYAAVLGMQALPGSPAEKDSALSTLTAALLALQEA